MWIKHSDGSVATDSSGNPLQTVQTFDIPVWNDKANFWPLGALDHIKSDFNSGLKSCSLIYQIPSDAQLKNGDTVAFQVLDENGNVLADDNTETQRYPTVSIQYKFEDGSEIPNTAGGTFPVPYGTKLNLTPAKSLYGYEFVKADGLNTPIVSDGTVVTYYYKNKSEEYTSPEKIMSVKEYAYTMLDRYSDDEHSKLRTLLVDLLNYGAAAQIYAGYQTDNLVNSDLTDVQKDWASKDTTEFKNIRNLNYKTISNPTAEWKTCSLVLKNSIMVKVKFSAKDVENKTVEIVLKNAKFTYTKDDFVNNGDGTYYVYCNELFANELSDNLLFTIYENGKPCSNTMLFSVESYARLVRDNYKDKPLDKMTTAMMLYGNSAKAYGA